MTGPEEISRPSLAMHHLLIASEEGNNADAQNMIGQMKELGLGGEKSELMFKAREDIPSIDIAAARSWYKKAMKQGHAGATFNIGCLYESGLGVEKDMERAIEFFKMAARIGHAEATERCEDLKSVGLI